jgi:hypothetical protein
MLEGATTRHQCLRSERCVVCWGLIRRTEAFASAKRRDPLNVDRLYRIFKRLTLPSNLVYPFPSPRSAHEEESANAGEDSGTRQAEMRERMKNQSRGIVKKEPLVILEDRNDDAQEWSGTFAT